MDGECTAVHIIWASHVTLSRQADQADQGKYCSDSTTTLSAAITCIVGVLEDSLVRMKREWNKTAANKSSAVHFNTSNDVQSKSPHYARPRATLDCAAGQGSTRHIARESCRRCTSAHAPRINLSTQATAVLLVTVRYKSSPTAENLTAGYPSRTRPAVMLSDLVRITSHGEIAGGEGASAWGQGAAPLVEVACSSD